MDKEISNLIADLKPSLKFRDYVERLFQHYFKSRVLEPGQEKCDSDFVHLINQMVIYYVLIITEDVVLESLKGDFELPGIEHNKNKILLYSRSGFVNKYHVIAFIEIIEVLLKGTDVENIELFSTKETKKEDACFAIVAKQDFIIANPITKNI